MKKFAMLCLILIAMGCQNEDLNQVEGNKPRVENARTEDEKLVQLIEVLEQVNSDFKIQITDDRAKTRGIRDFLIRSIVIAGADASGMIAAGSGIGTMVNVGLITPPGAVAAATAIVVCGAAASIGAAISTGVIRNSASSMSSMNYGRNIGLSYTSKSLPIFVESGSSLGSITFPKNYKEISIVGIWHNDIVKKWIVPGTPWKEYKMGNTDWEMEWANTLNPAMETKAYNLCNISKEAFTQIRPSDKYKSLLNNYKMSNLMNEEVYSVCKYFLDAYLLCEKRVDIENLVNKYIGVIWSRHALFTEAEFQAMLAGFTVALESPRFWDNIYAY